jgi:DNA-binding PadR family transcriptional regulator
MRPPDDLPPEAATLPSHENVLVLPQIDGFEALILLLCSIQPRGASAYDIKQSNPAQLRSLGTAGAKASSVMKRLEERGYLSSQVTAGKKGRAVTRYTTTKLGRSELKRWVVTGGTAPAADAETSIRLRAGAVVTRGEIVRGLLASRLALERALAEENAEIARRREQSQATVEEEWRSDLRRSLLQAQLDWLKRVEDDWAIQEEGKR